MQLHMLTKKDLDQLRKSLQDDTRKIIREEVENEAQAIKDELGAEITSSRMRVQNDIEEVKDRVKNVEIRVTKMHKDLKAEIKMVSHMLDKDNIQTAKKVKQIEQHLGISS